ncbi:MAG: SAM-dependent methyltransferase [Paenibacillus sp.]|jgi:SAM-dependent methyltransferase|nr:SAM-dependent methyltransferase [Paenibacillus sp.]
MNKLLSLFTQIITSNELVQAVISNPKHKTGDGIYKVKIKQVQLKAGLMVQFEYHYARKVTHENVELSLAAGHMAELLLSGTFKQGLVQTNEADYHILMNKKGEASILKKAPTRTEQVVTTHNRKKQYLLEEGNPVPFLVELGVMNAQGKVLAAKYDKFRQINRYLEMVEDVVGSLQTGRTLNIVDFGCGKSYLTFALYHYLKEVRKLDIQVIGLDLKEEVIAHCSGLAKKLGLDRLQFLVGDIAQYKGLERVDMVVTLHACDTATDAALEKAVRWEADVILSVPCCQHELFSQLENARLGPMLGHGIIRERFAALATDSIRASLLDLLGYKTQILEFIDLEHTPKNLLIRAVKQKQTAGTGSRSVEAADASALSAVPQSVEPLLSAAQAAKVAAYRSFVVELHATPYLERALQDKLAPLFAAADADAGR